MIGSDTRSIEGVVHKCIYGYEGCNFRLSRDSGERFYFPDDSQIPPIQNGIFIEAEVIPGNADEGPVVYCLRAWDAHRESVLFEYQSAVSASSWPR